MDLIQLPPNSLRIGQVLNFSLRDAAGHLLVAGGQTLPNTPQMRALLATGVWVLAHETKEYQRAMAHKMDTLMHQGASLGDIVKVQAEFVRPDRNKKPDLGEQAAWADLQMHAHSLLRDPRTDDFRNRFQQLHQDAIARLSHKPDAILMLLIYDAAQGFEKYSGRHALLCLALAELCAAKLGWPDDWRLALTQAALSMNISISAQQDRLASQVEEPAHSQKQALISHGDRSAALLSELGASSELWLKTVCLHHDAGPGPLAGRAPPDQLARLLRRIDIFASRISPRGSRKAQPGAMAARAVFLDELKQPDEAGAAIVKTLGLYPLGSWVRLANGEIGIVFKRGHSATEPMVASLLGKSGNPLSEPVPRDTRLATQAISASLAPHELKLRVSMEKLLKL